MRVLIDSRSKRRSLCSKPTRSINELDKFLPVLSKVDPLIQSTSIKDFHRLGKYKEVHTRPRLILVKFLRSFDANTVLSNRSQIPPPFVIKPDMSQEDRTHLRERWNLIQQGSYWPTNNVINRPTWQTSEVQNSKFIYCSTRRLSSPNIANTMVVSMHLKGSTGWFNGLLYFQQSWQSVFLTLRKLETTEQNYSKWL